MFSKWFGRKEAPTPDLRRRSAAILGKAPSAQPAAPDPDLRRGAERLVEQLIERIEDTRGVHVESLLAALGSLAGFCAIDGVLRRCASDERTRDCEVVIVETRDGGRYYFGDPVNHLLAGTDRSLLAFVAADVDHPGRSYDPDFADISAHVAGTLGGPAFGIPRVPPPHAPAEAPLDYVRTLWPVVKPLVESHAPDLDTRMTLFGLAAQRVMAMGKDIMPPTVAAKLVMECAVPMSKLDPATIPA